MDELTTTALTQALRDRDDASDAVAFLRTVVLCCADAAHYDPARNAWSFDATVAPRLKALADTLRAAAQEVS